MSNCCYGYMANNNLKKGVERESKSKKNTGKEKKMAPADGPARGVGGMRQSLLDAYKEDEFNAKQLEKKMGKKICWIWRLNPKKIVD